MLVMSVRSVRLVKLVRLMRLVRLVMRVMRVRIIIGDRHCDVMLFPQRWNLSIPSVPAAV